MIVGESGVLELGGGCAVRVFRWVNVGRMGESLGLSFVISASWGTGSGPQETFLPLTEGGVEMFGSGGVCLEVSCEGALCVCRGPLL